MNGIEKKVFCGPSVPCSKCKTPTAPRPGRDRRCLPCKRAQQNAANSANPEKLREKARARYAANSDYWKEYADRKKTDPQYRLKRSARRKVSTEIEAGRMARNPCEDCGADRSEAHHEDYAKPLDIRWLCKRCHCKADAVLAARTV